jgi:CRISPR system Cascade subunit CasE
MLNPRLQIVRRDLADCQAMHARLLSAFSIVASETPRASVALLYRLETDARLGFVSLLAQSRREPDWKLLPAGYLSANDEAKAASCKNVEAKFDLLQNDARLRFRLRANPTKKIDTKTAADGKRRNGKRVELRKEEEQFVWLKRKSEQHGFRLRALQVIDEDKSKGWRGNRRSNAQTEATIKAQELHGDTNGEPVKQRLTFASVLFDGELIVTNKELFRLALEEGIGGGKAYGFGLLSIAPAFDD